MPGYKNLEQYGLIGNLRTCALVGDDGSIDWACFPHIESPSVFAALLDAEKGGHFVIQPTLSFQSTQSYVGETNVLETRFKTASGQVTLTDFMPVESPGGFFRDTILRRIHCTRGSVKMRFEFMPQFDYARQKSRYSTIPEGILAVSGENKLYLGLPFQIKADPQCAAASFLLYQDDTEWMTVTYGRHYKATAVQCEKLLNETLDYWNNWRHDCESERCFFSGPWHDLVVRSGLVLKLLTHRETGAIAAAATTSLPEIIGGVRNWDYRYNWIRDASFTIQALYNLGHTEEAAGFLEWFAAIGRSVENPSRLKIMYGLHGETEIPEMELRHLSGYRYSRPVRIGNGAAEQKQHDIFGEFIQAVYETSRYGETIPEDIWEFVKKIADHVCEIWTEPDTGIWEVRGGSRHFVYSKVMCWVALDRAIKMGMKADDSDASSRWSRVRFKLRETIIGEGFNEDLNSFVQSFGTEDLDATGLLIPMTGFLDYEDERVQGTIEAVRKELTDEHGLVYRYHSRDGLPGGEGVFVLCSFWLVDALALSGRLHEAEQLFGKIIKYATPLGLFAEEIDPKTGQQLGNFPQAFSHIGLINSALYLACARGKKPMGPEPIGFYGV